MPRPRSNDVILLESRLTQNRNDTCPEVTDGVYFLLSSVDTILRDRQLSYAQIEDGIVDGPNDGGIDAIYTFLNGKLIEDDTEPVESTAPQIDLEIFQIKNEHSFKEMALQLLIGNLPVLLQLDEDTSLQREFNERVLERLRIFQTTFLRNARHLPDLSIRVRYVTKAVGPPHEKVNRKADRLQREVKKSFQASKVETDLIGAGELNVRARRRLVTSLTLKASETPISGDKGGLVCLVSLADYCNFIRDENVRLRERIFEENVRDFEGDTTINGEIANSLAQGDGSPVDFWWLNNGVTILGRRVQPTGRQLIIEDPQIVNGYQTSKSIYQYFTGLSSDSEEGKIRQVLVRVIESSDESISTQIIKATNSQNRITEVNLRATDPFQRSIEEFFLKHGLYYERRKNYYKNQGKPRLSIVGVRELAQAIAAIALHKPDTSRARPISLLRNPLYEEVFSESAPLAAFLKCIRIVQRVDAYLGDCRVGLGRQGRSNVRFHLARAVTAFALSSALPTMAIIVGVSPGSFSDDWLDLVYEWLMKVRDSESRKSQRADDDVLAKGPEWAREISLQLRRYEVEKSWPQHLIPS